MGALTFRAQSIYRECTLNRPGVDAQAQDIALVIVTLAKCGKLRRNLGFECRTESRMLGMVVSV